MFKLVDALGRVAFENVKEINYFLGFVIEVLRKLFTFHKQKQIGFIVLLRQILFTGYESLPIVILIAICIGGLIILEFTTFLGSTAQGNMLYTILVTVITRELGCLMTAFIVIARSGTAISTEMGYMVINKEIELLMSFGISPISYLVVSRTVGVVVAIFTLSIYFNLAGLVGGWMFSYFFSKIPFNEFAQNLLSAMTFTDVLQSVVKSICFGFAIALISCYQGLKVNFASTEIPQRTIKAVVYSITTIVFLDVIITLVFSKL